MTSTNPQNHSDQEVTLVDLAAILVQRRLACIITFPSVEADYRQNKGRHFPPQVVFDSPRNISFVGMETLAPPRPAELVKEVSWLLSYYVKARQGG